MSINCLDARSTHLKVVNSIFANSGSYTVALLFGGSIFNIDPLFTDNSKNDYSLQSASPARDPGDKEISTQFPNDMKNHSRIDDEGPDLGAWNGRIQRGKSNKRNLTFPLNVFYGIHSNYFSN